MLFRHQADHFTAPILSTVHAVIAVAEARRSPGTAANAYSPARSRGVSRVMVASVPIFERTVALARPF